MKVSGQQQHVAQKSVKQQTKTHRKHRPSPKTSALLLFSVAIPLSPCPIHPLPSSIYHAPIAFIHPLACAAPPPRSNILEE